MTRITRTKMSATLTLLLASGACVAQQIGVTVDGTPVAFAGARPMVISGRVLVPLRGVLEQVGAFVDWVPATRTVIAQKGDTYVELPVGSKTAIINSRAVNLDVPAQVMTGSTMVPLRFLGEALGAEVTWDAPTRTVVIATGAAPEPGNAQPQQVEITSFSHDAHGWLKAGCALSVTMRGTPGGTATFEVPGVVDQVRMDQTSSGVYRGKWVVPSGKDITVSEASVIGLLRVGGRERLIQAGEPVSVDTVAPKIKSQLPQPGSTVSQMTPSVSAVFDDGAGSGIDTTTVKITVNGTDVTDKATVTSTFVTYRPTANLPAGENSVVIAAEDAAGNSISERWVFRLTAAADVIKSFTTSDLRDLQPGDVITVRMQAQPKGTASFSFVLDSRTLRTRPMQQTSAGIYEGEYTVRRDDSLTGAAVVGTFKTAGGQTYTAQADNKIGVTPGTLVQPVIKSPASGARVTSPLVVSGTAPAGSRVRVQVDYVTTVLRALQLRGTVSEQLLEVANTGAWETEPINLGTLVRGKHTEYTIAVTTVGPEGQESEAAVVTVAGA